MSFLHFENIGEKELVPGFKGRFVHSDSMTIGSWNVSEGAVMPEHAHPHEQIFTLLEGKFELTIRGESKVQNPGAVAVIPSNVPHSGRAITPCRVIDVFCPVREDMK